MLSLWGLKNPIETLSVPNPLEKTPKLVGGIKGMLTVLLVAAITGTNRVGQRSGVGKKAKRERQLPETETNG